MALFLLRGGILDTSISAWRRVLPDLSAKGAVSVDMGFAQKLWVASF